MPDVSDRLSKLMKMLEKDPNDPFLLYAIALEHKKGGKLSEALQYLQRTTEKDPDYSVAYQQAAQVHEQAGDLEAAREAYRRGIAVAGRKGDHHAAEEMQAALMMIE